MDDGARSKTIVVILQCRYNQWNCWDFPTRSTGASTVLLLIGLVHHGYMVNGVPVHGSSVSSGAFPEGSVEQTIWLLASAN